jgi:hypothetical protein
MASAWVGSEDSGAADTPRAVVVRDDSTDDRERGIADDSHLGPLARRSPPTVLRHH